ncbi:MAG: T9SS type B sorting domain-containing protein, partial [Bacteroidia bacterium]
ICILDGSITISGSSVTNGTVNWGTDGNGTFDDPSLLNPTYTLGATDTGILKLYMDVTANIGCKTATDTMLLTIYGIPAVDAGPDIDVCAGDSDVPVSGATYSDGIISWTTSGDGTFDDAAIINPVYTFGVSDTGPVTLTITVTSPGSCGIVSDNLVVNFVPGPVTDAGGDDAVCATTAAYPVNDASYSGGTVLWTTGGDGTFDDATSGSPLYTFGVNDIGAGTVTLTMTVTSTGTCGADIDDKILTLWPSPVIVLDEHSDISCNGLTDGIIRISGGGSTAPYQYSINGGAYQLSGDFTLLGAGDYDLSVIDANGCIHDTTVTIVDPELFAYTFDGYSDNTCFGANDGSISITITGGTLPYAINWTGPNGYASTDEDISGLEPGSYSLNLTDANSCSLFTLNQDIGTPPEIVITPVAISDYNGYGVSCNGGNNGFIEADVSGGTGTLTTIWTGPNGFSSSDEDISGLEAGNYILTVTDATSCPVIYSVILTEPAELSVTYDVTDASCPGDANGQIDLFVTGGVLPYIFMWDDNNPNEDRNDILPGDYSVDITDANGCEEQIFITVGVIGYNCVVVPEVITPGVVDGKNDEVIIKNIDMFPEAEIKIFTRWGKLIFSAKNLADNRWNGTYEGKLMPVDSYHYILDLKDGSKPLTGTITIIR